MAEDISIAGTPYQGKLRNPLAVIGLTLITLGIYSIFWYYKVNKELADIGEARGTWIGSSVMKAGRAKRS